MAAGKCPQCHSVVTEVRIRSVDAVASDATAWRAITYNCPYCATILGCEIDPIALKAGIVDEVTRAISR